MNQPAQQIPSNPALDFANAILEETNGGLELIEILHDIAQGIDEDATTNDRITAANILSDRGFGKCPKQTPVTHPTPKTDDNDLEPAPYSIRGENRESPPAVPHNEPESPRLVTQIKDALQDALGPAPTPSTTQQTPLSTNHYPLQSIIQQHILEITNNGQTLRDTLLEIARSPDEPKACPEQEPALSLSKGRRIKPCHRARAARILLDRLLGTDPTSVRSGVSLAHAPDAAEAKPKFTFDAEKLDAAWAEVLANTKRLEDEGILDPNRPVRKFDISNLMKATDEEIAPYAAEEAAKFRAEIDLRVERQKKWPEFEEYRRKKLAEIYPSHSQDDKPPET